VSARPLRSAWLAATLLLAAAGRGLAQQEAQRIDPALSFALRVAARGAPVAARTLPGHRPPGVPAVGADAALVVPGLAALDPVGPDGRPAAVRVLVRVGPGGEAALLRAGARLGARAGNILTARVPVDGLEALVGDPAILRIEAAAALRSGEATGPSRAGEGRPGAAGGRRSPFRLTPVVPGASAAQPAGPQGFRGPSSPLAPRAAALALLANDIGAQEIGVERLRQRSRDGFLGLAGQGVIIGIYDTGLDLEHPDFRAADGRTRVLFAWDQSDSSSGRTPPGQIGSDVFDYGHECRAADIDAGACPLVDNIGHGTHVAGTAAGTGAGTGNGLPAGRYPGVAPAADLIVVKGGDGSFTADRVLDGVAYIFDRAAELGRPAVVVLSLSTQAGPHDGTTLLEQALDSLSGRGRIIVAAAGNWGNNDNARPGVPQPATHSHGVATQVAAVDHGLRIPPYTPNPGSISDAAALELWYDGADELRVTIISPRGDSVSVATGDSAVVATPGGAIYVNNAAAGPNPANGDRQALIILFDSTEAAPPDTGLWTIRVRGDAIAASGEHHLWLVGASFQNPTRPPRLDPARNTHLVGSPGTATRVITAAAFVTRHEWTRLEGEPFGFPFREMLGDIAFFSPAGPRRDGVLKPDIAAPGKFTISARARNGQIWRDFPDFVEADGVHGALLGTSMAAPHVAGAVALLLQLRPDLDPEAARELLTANARQDAFTSHPYTGEPDGVPNAQWGHGKLAVERAVWSLGLPAGMLTLDVTPLPPPERLASAGGARVPLFRLNAATDSAEAIALERLTFELTGTDPGAALVLIHDEDADGDADPDEPVHASVPVALGGGPVTARIEPGPVVPAGASEQFVVALEMSGAAPNGARFSARYLPGETRTLGTLSGARDRFQGPVAVVESGERTTSLLEPGERFTLSANPVRAAPLVISYAARPRAAAVYSIAGQRVRDLGSAMGEGSVEWDLRNDQGVAVASGAYYLVLEFPGERVVRKLFVVRP
jgi:subtilisin family serine protease